MKEITETSKAVLRGDPITWNDLTLFPILVLEYEKFNSAKSGIVLSQQTLPAKYAGLKYLEALYALDADRIQNGEPPVGLFSKAMHFLTLALRLPEKTDDQGKRYLPVRVIVKENDVSKLSAVLIEVEGKDIKITPKDFNKLRILLAEMNGLELPNEAHNAELEEAERDLAARGSMGLHIDFEDMIYSVSVQSGVSVNDILEWPMRKFFKVKAAIDRGIGYRLAYLAEASGATYKRGNPWPSWVFDREKGLSSALIPMGQFQKQLNGTVALKKE